MQTVAVRFEPSASAGVIGYNLSVATAPGAPGSGMQVDIPANAARVEAGGVLAFDVQMSANVAHYLTMRAYSTQTFSPFSNEIVIPAVASMATTSIATTTALAIGDTNGAAASSSGSGGSVSANPGTAMGSGSTSGTSGSSDPNTTTSTTNSSSAAAMSSLDFDGAGEFLASSVANPLGASSQFTLSIWAVADPSATGSRALVSVRGGSGATQNRVELGSDATTLTLTVTNDAGQTVYDASWAGALVPGEWQHFALSFDASVDSAPILLIDGMTRAPTTANLTGNPPTYSDTAGRVFVGGSGSATAGTWLGEIGHAAFFSLALGDDEINEIATRGHTLDLRENSGAYQASDALLHYWRLGEDPNAVGYDSGSASTPIDLDDASGYIDGADIVADAPVLLQ